MDILSLAFLCFCAGVVLVYFSVPRKWQLHVLAAASTVFYLSFSMEMFFYILSASVIVYYAALALEEAGRRMKEALSAGEAEEKKRIRKEGQKRKQLLSAVALVTIFGIWGIIKYSGFAVETANGLLGILGLEGRFQVSRLLLPVGMSFYIFTAASYLIDIYRGKYPAEEQFLKLFTFVTFFPHIVQGPFSRYDKLGGTLFQEHSFSYDRMCLGLRRMLWGFFKKIVIAEALARPITEIFSNYELYPGIYVLVAMASYAFQIYADFSGYMDIMCGFCRILGIVLAENFRQPYFAESVEDFWKRWHITLGAWFKDYVFFPISTGATAQRIGRSVRKKYGPKPGKLVPGYFAMIFVWTMTGLWHGASWDYAVWGWMNLLLIILELQTADIADAIRARLHIRPDVWWWRTFRVIRTFFLVGLLRLFSHGDGIPTALGMLRNLFVNNYTVLFHPSTWFPTGDHTFMNRVDVLILTGAVFAMMAADWIREKEWCGKVAMPIRTFGYALCLILIVISLASGANLAGGFMYARF